MASSLSATILSPAFGSFLNGQFPVTGAITAGDSDIASWTLRLRNDATDVTYILAKGTGAPTSETLGTFRASSYATGRYSLELETVDKSGAKALAAVFR